MTKFDLRSLQSDSVAFKWMGQLHTSLPKGQLYRNAARASASARQADAYAVSAARAELAVRPLLAYYAFLHFIKTVLYLLDVQYPASTSVLQHGLSSRRTKREAYRLPLDYVSVYKEGVLQSFSALAYPELTLPTRFVIGDLFGSIPGTVEAVASFYPQFRHLPSGSDPAESAATVADETMPEWLAHYVLLFALSSICRYNPAEWSDMVLWHNDADGYLIREYLRFVEDVGSLAEVVSDASSHLFFKGSSSV